MVETGRTGRICRVWDFTSLDIRAPKSVLSATPIYPPPSCSRLADKLSSTGRMTTPPINNADDDDKMYEYRRPLRSVALSPEPDGGGVGRVERPGVLLLGAQGGVVYGVGSSSPTRPTRSPIPSLCVRRCLDPLQTPVLSFPKSSYEIITVRLLHSRTGP